MKIQVFAHLGMDYTKTCERVMDNGEPGFAWLENMQQYSRMQSTEKVIISLYRYRIDHIPTSSLSFLPYIGL